MSEDYVFLDTNNRKYKKNDILQCLKGIGADQCDILFVHTDVMFGVPNPELGRKGYLQALYDVLLSLNVRTLIFPAFSYSFCNHEDYDVRNSKTSMGALIEYIRKQPNVHRSFDPLLSMIAVGENAGIVDREIGFQALGPGSGFERIHLVNDVKFLFFGADFDECFTYIHHIEKVLKVPYRYDQSFSGYIIDYDGNRFEHVHSINTQCGGVTLKNFAELKRDLMQDGILNVAKLGNLEVACASEKSIYCEVVTRIDNNPNTFVLPYTERDLTHEYMFGKNGERITHC